MRVVRHTDQESFVARARPFLLTRAVENHLMLGLLTERLATALRLTIEDEGGAVVGAALQTPPYKLLVTVAPDPALHALAELLLASKMSWLIPGCVGPAAAARRVANSYGVRAGSAARRGMVLRLLACDALLPPRPPEGGGGPRVATPGDRPLVSRWVDAFAAETGTPTAVAIVERMLERGDFLVWATGPSGAADATPVAMAGVSRRGPTGAHLAHVYTPPELRGRGYASAVTAALTARELAAGHACLLFTDADNPTSNHIYEALGYRWRCDYEEWCFQ